MNPDDVALTALHQHLRQVAPLPDAEWAFLSGHVRGERFERGEQLVRCGAEPRAIWLLLQGIVRFFYVSEGGRECNKAFARPGELIGPLVAVATGQP